MIICEVMPLTCAPGTDDETDADRAVGSGTKAAPVSGPVTVAMIVATTLMTGGRSVNSDAGSPDADTAAPFNADWSMVAFGLTTPPAAATKVKLRLA